MRFAVYWLIWVRWTVRLSAKPPAKGVTDSCRDADAIPLHMPERMERQRVCELGVELARTVIARCMANTFGVSREADEVRF